MSGLRSGAGYNGGDGVGKRQGATAGGLALWLQEWDFRLSSPGAREGKEMAAMRQTQWPGVRRVCGRDSSLCRISLVTETGWGEGRTLLPKIPSVEGIRKSLKELVLRWGLRAGGLMREPVSSQLQAAATAPFPPVVAMRISASRCQVLRFFEREVRLYVTFPNDEI